MPVDTPFAAIANVDHANNAGADLQTARFSGSYPGDAPPGTDQRIPAIVSAGDLTLSETVEDGRAVKEPVEPGAYTLELGRDVDGKDRLDDVLDGRLTLGRIAEVGLVGTGADGTVYTDAAPLILARGRVSSEVGGGPHDDRRAITIQPHQTIRQRRIPSRELLGYGEALLGNGTTSLVTTLYAATPTAFTLQCRALIPRLWEVASGNRPTFFVHPNCHFFARRTAGGEWQLCFSYRISGGTLEEVTGPTIEAREWLKWVSVRFTTTTKAVVFGVDDVFTSATGVAAYSGTTGTWDLMKASTASTTMFSLCFAWMIFDAAIADADLIAAQRGRLSGDETNLDAWWPGETNLAGSLTEAAEANAGSPRTGTYTNCTPCPAFEGDLDAAGTVLPVIFQGRNMRLHPVGGFSHWYRAASEGVEGLTWIGDRGAPVTATPVSSVAAAIRTTPAAGEVVYCADLGGIAHFDTLLDSAELAADVLGVSGWSHSLRLGSTYANAYVEFPVAANPGGDDFVLELWGSWGDLGGDGLYLFQGQYADIRNVTSHADPSLVDFVAEIYTASDSVQMTFTIQRHSTIAIRVEAWNDGANAAARLLINGREVDSGTATGNLVSSFTMESFLGSSFGLFLPVEWGVLPMRLWGPGAVGATTALAEAHARKFLFRHPEDGVDAEYADLLGLYRHPAALTTVSDEVGGNHGTVINSGTYGNWRPGLCWSDPLSATIHVLRDWGGMAESDIEITPAAWERIEWAPQDLWFGSEPAMDTALAASRAIGPGYVLMRPDETVVLGVMVEPTAGNVEYAVAAADVTMIGPGDSPSLPPTEVEFWWARVGLEQTPLPSALPARATLISRPHGTGTVRVGNNRTVWDDLDYPDGRRLYGGGDGPRSRYRDRAPARRRAEAEALLWEDLRPLIPVALAGGGRNVVPGMVVAIPDYRDVGTTIYAVLVSRSAKPDHEDWIVR